MLQDESTKKRKVCGQLLTYIKTNYFSVQRCLDDRSLKALGVVLKHNTLKQRQLRFDAIDTFNMFVNADPCVNILFGLIKQTAITAAGTGEIIAKLNATTYFTSMTMQSVMNPTNYNHDKFVTLLRRAGFHYCHEVFDAQAWVDEVGDTINLGWIGWSDSAELFDRYARGHWQPRLQNPSGTLWQKAGKEVGAGYYNPDIGLQQYIEQSDSCYVFTMSALFELPDTA